MPANIDSMAYYGETPWHGLGVPLSAPPDSATMIKAAGLDWKVEMPPAPGTRLAPDGRPLKCQILRKARDNRERDIMLGLVSRQYVPLQNQEAFRFFDAIVGEGAAIYETAGALGDGERVWVLANVPGEIRVSRNDMVRKYLLLSNSHTGDSAVCVKFTPIRVVCQNTLILALKDGEKAFRVRHSKSMHWRLAEVAEFLRVVHEVFQAAEESFRMLIRVKMTPQRLDDYLESVLPRSADEKRTQTRPRRWQAITVLFDTPDARVPEVRHTLWAAYNAVIRFEDYRETRGTAERRLDRVWFGAGADLKLQALQAAERFAASWQ